MTGRILSSAQETEARVIFKLLNTETPRTDVSKATPYDYFNSDHLSSLAWKGVGGDPVHTAAAGGP